jgi:plastocyanin
VKKLLALTAATALTAAVAVPAIGATRTINVGDYYFVSKSGPHRATVTRGTIVRWKFVGRIVHNVVVTKGPQKFRSPTRGKGYVFRHKMTRRGTYKIVCTIHPGMAMTLKVT